MNLTIVYKFQGIFVAGTFSCPAHRTEEKLTLKLSKATSDDKKFIKNKSSAKKLQENFRLKDFYPIKTYFKYEGYEIDDGIINQIKDILHAENIWVNFQESDIISNSDLINEREIS